MAAAVFRAERWFSGRVQGVGFRARTLQTAREFEVTGLVRNLPDGRVHLVAEGAAKEVRAFVAAVEERQAIFIRETQTRDHEEVGREHASFTFG